MIWGIVSAFNVCPGFYCSHGSAARNAVRPFLSHIITKEGELWGVCYEFTLITITSLQCLMRYHFTLDRVIMVKNDFITGTNCSQVFLSFFSFLVIQIHFTCYEQWSVIWCNSLKLAFLNCSFLNNLQPWHTSKWKQIQPPGLIIIISVTRYSSKPLYMIITCKLLPPYKDQQM